MSKQDRTLLPIDCFCNEMGDIRISQLKITAIRGNLPELDNEIDSSGKQLRIPTICLMGADMVLPGKVYCAKGTGPCLEDRQILKDVKKNLNYFGLVFHRSQQNILQNDVYKIGILAKLTKKGYCYSDFCFTFISLKRFEIVKKYDLNPRKLKFTVKLVEDFSEKPNPLLLQTLFPKWAHKLHELAYLDGAVRNELPKSFLKKMNPNSVLPQDPIKLSFEIIRFLDLNEKERNELLGMRSPEQRLRAALSAMTKFEFFKCKDCDEIIFDQSDVFTAQNGRTKNMGYQQLAVKKTKIELLEHAHHHYFPICDFFPRFVVSLCFCPCGRCLGYGLKRAPEKFWLIFQEDLKPNE